MRQSVEINSFLVTKLKPSYDSFIKYDIEISIDEIENEEDHIKLKYKFVFLSNPANVKLSVDGFSTTYGNQRDLSKYLNNDERNVPHIVNAIYQEIFPFLYVTAKTMQIPCPAYRLSDIIKTRQSEETSLERVERTEFEPLEHAKSANSMIETGDQEDDIETIKQESLMQEQKINTF